MNEREHFETCDMLLDYMDARPDLNDRELNALYEAWEQQDLYPCISGENIRTEINNQAIQLAENSYRRRKNVALGMSYVALRTGLLSIPA